MADKEATVYIVDLASSMGRKANGRDETDLNWALRYIWDKITTTVATGRKTANLGVLGLRTDDTNHDLGNSDGYEHISVLQRISQILLPDLRTLEKKLQVSGIDEGDAISALVVAIEMITAYTKKLKYKRKIVLVTNGTGPMDADEVEEIASKIRADNMELIVLGVDFDDAEYGFKEEDKPSIKAENEASLRKLTEACDGVFGTLEQAIAELGTPRVKTTRPTPSFRGQLTLGHPESKSTLRIDVERYPRTMIAKAPSASSFVSKSDPMHIDGSAQSSATVVADGEQGQPPSSSNLTSVKNTRTYKVEDPDAPGGKREVEREELAKGYEYGRTAVHISETEENVTKLETKSSLEIVGFVPKDNYERYMHMSTANMIVGQRTNDKAAMALSSLVRALYELDSYGIARLVTKDDKPPVLVLLAPSIEPDYECLLDVQLPFAEDVRAYKFPPLDKIITVSGKILTEHRNLPSEQLQDAMSAYVDKMDLSEYGRDDEGQPCEYAQMEDTYSPVLHRIDQAVRIRAVHPEQEIPPPSEALTRYSQPLSELVDACQAEREKLTTVADVKKVPPKAKSRRDRRNQPKPMSGLDVGALLSRERQGQSDGQHGPQISKENAIPEFKQFLATTDDASTISQAVHQLSLIVEKRITHSFGDAAYGTALEEIRVMREEMTELEEPELFNDFLRALKKKLLSEELGGDRKDMWWTIRRAKMGLITQKACGVSDVTEGQAEEFLSKQSA